MAAERQHINPLGTMYLVSALLMFLALLAITVLMFVPTDWRERLGPSTAYVPGSGPAFEPLNRPAVVAVETLGTEEVAPGRYVVTMHAFNWSFEPNEVRVPVGSTVTFRATSIEDYHGIAIIGTDVILSLKQNEPSEATYTFTEPGAYFWVCSEYCGAGHVSMNGWVYVE
jgi:cytochrome c oxidase subunit II